MTEDGTTKRRPAQRSTEGATRLERMRQRNADQLEAQRAAERRVEAALTAYLDADTSISGVEQSRDEKIAGLQQQIDQVRAAAQEELGQIRRRQAVAVWQLKDAGRSLEQIADLLELPLKEARQLLATGRAAETSDTPEGGGKDSLPVGNRTPAADSQQPTQQPPQPAPHPAEPNGADPSLVPNGQQLSTPGSSG